MPTHYTDRANVELPAAGADTWTRDPGIKHTGNILYKEAIYTLTSGTDETSGDIIRICKLPEGCILIPHLCKIIAEDPGTAFNIAKIGDDPVESGAFTGDDDRYSGAVDISAGGAFDLLYAARPGGLAGYTLEGDAWIIATLGTVTTPTAGQDVRFVIAYAAQN